MFVQSSLVLCAETFANVTGAYNRPIAPSFGRVSGLADVAGSGWYKLGDVRTRLTWWV